MRYEIADRSGQSVDGNGEFHSDTDSDSDDSSDAHEISSSLESDDDLSYHADEATDDQEVATLDDGKMHQLHDFAGVLRRVMITCALNMTPAQLEEVAGINIELATAWKKTATRLWELQCIYIAPNLRESNFDVSLAARDIDDPRITTDQWRDIRSKGLSPLTNPT